MSIKKNPNICYIIRAAEPVKVLPHLVSLPQPNPEALGEASAGGGVYGFPPQADQGFNDSGIKGFRN